MADSADSEPTGATSATGESESSADRKARLIAMKGAADAQSGQADAAAEDVLSGESDSPINLGSMLADKQDRLRQLRLLRGFFESPQWVDLTQDLVPTSSTREEIEQRKKQIAYQIEVLEALLDLMKAEKGLLEKADLPPLDEDRAASGDGGGMPGGAG